MEIRFLGHSSCTITGSARVVVDPFLSGNPSAAISADEIGAVDVVVVTHDHEDHIMDAPAICKATGATLVSTHEIAVDCASEHGIEAEGMNIGGTLDVKGIQVHMVNALHSSPTTDCTGVVIEMDGKQIYHLGDTGLFGDMALYREFFDFDVALVPIGDRYTMGPRSAARAVSMLKPKVVIPIHYNTFPIIEQDPNEFARLVGDEAEVVILSPGQTYSL